MNLPNVSHHWKTRNLAQVIIEKMIKQWKNIFFIANDTDFLSKSDGRYSTSKLDISGARKDRHHFWQHFEAFFQGLNTMEKKHKCQMRVFPVMGHNFCNEDNTICESRWPLSKTKNDDAGRLALNKFISIFLYLLKHVDFKSLKPFFHFQILVLTFAHCEPTTIQDTSPPNLAAAETAFNVIGNNDSLLCSTMTRVLLNRCSCES
jgi:hypothetical protein